MTRAPRLLRLGACLPALAVVVGACGTEPGTLVMIVDDVPSVTIQTTLAITGLVTRSPAATTVLVITATTGAGTVTDTASNGAFSVDVPLTLNAVNSITLTPSDAQGSAGAPQTFVVLQDGSPPMVTAMTPTGDGVATSVAGVTVTMSEPVVLTGVGAGMRLANGDRFVPGGATLSADSLTFTFTPSGPLLGNAIFSPVFIGVEDAAGNPALRSVTSCFVTVFNSTAQLVARDSIDDTFGLQAQGGPVPQFASPSDLVAARFAIKDSLFTGVFEFPTPRSVSPGAPNNLALLIEIDIDRNPNTGVRSIRDTFMLLAQAPAFLSRTTADYIIVIDSLPSLGGASAVGQYTAFNDITITAPFVPGVCGKFVSFTANLAALNNDDGDMDVSLFAINLEGPGLFDPLIVDPMPDSSTVAIRFAGQFVAPAPALLAPSYPGPTLRVRLPPALKRR